MYRWILLVACFLAAFIVSAWLYIYSYRVEFFQLGLSSAFPQEKVMLESSDVRLSLKTISLTLKSVSIQHPVSKDERLPLFEASKIYAEMSLPSFLWWAIFPSTSPLPLKILTISVLYNKAPLSSLPGPTIHTKPLTFQVDAITLLLGREKKAVTVYTPDILTLRTLFETASLTLVENSP